MPPIYERAEGKERDFSCCWGLNTREHYPGIGYPGKQRSWRPTRVIHIWNTLNGEVREVRAYMSSRDISICFWERRKLAYTANKPKGWIKLNPNRGNRHRLNRPEFSFSFPFIRRVCAHARGFVSGQGWGDSVTIPSPHILLLVNLLCSRCFPNTP